MKIFLPGNILVAPLLCLSIKLLSNDGYYYMLTFTSVFDSRLGLRLDSGVSSENRNFRKSSQSRLLCFVITAIAKLATYHRELLPRARVAVGKVVCVLNF